MRGNLQFGLLMSVLSFIYAGGGGEGDEPCCTWSGDPDCSGDLAEGLFEPTFSLTFRSLNGKTVPGAIEDDGNGKDVSVSDRRKYKLSKESETGLDRRMRMKAKKDGGDASFASEFEVGGEVSAQVRVAVDTTAGTEGLVDGTTLGFLERRPANAGPIQRVEAVWSEAAGGFFAQASVGGTPLGLPLDLGGAQEVILYILDMDDQFALQAAVPTGDGLDEIAGGISGTLGFTDVDPLDTSGVFAIGAEGLGPKATLWFAHFNLEIKGFGAGTGQVESGATFALYNALAALESAAQMLALPEPHNLNTIYNLLVSASDDIGSPGTGGAWEILQNGFDADTLLPTTDGEKAIKTVKSARALSISVTTKLYDLILEGGATSGKAFKSKTLKMLDKVRTALGQVNGFNVKSGKKLDKAVSFEVK